MSVAEAARLLGVATDASIPDIQHAFAREARLSHPDLLVEASEQERHAAGIRFAELREARDELLSAKPVVPVQFVTAGPQFHRVPGRGMGRSVLVLLLLAGLIVVSVTAQDGFRTDLVQNIRGVYLEPVDVP
ncbi:MAG: putative chaperone [Naasia sp.]|jgi:hypothetical protein|uniref:J domain-containing protein n=1 Tax=Naasia sp. TaxID=2546198 RepID=UPI00261F41DA|nr:J domain-containing protein [Naasia sp.]MCU1571055.1 putative chaperone [Naasia sp.]